MSGTVIRRRALRNLRPDNTHDVTSMRGQWSVVTYPGAVQVYRDKGRRDGEVIHEGVELQHEPELVRCGDKLKRKKED